MAKQLVSPIERHLDKAVLGLAGLILIGVAAKYFVSSPNQLDLRGENVTPHTIDQRVEAKALEVREAIRRATPSGVDFEPRQDEFTAALSPFEASGLATSLSIAVPLLPEVPIVGPAKAMIGEVRLVDVVKLPKPIVRQARSTLLLDVPEDVDESMMDAYATATNWVVVSSLYDRREQTNRQRNAYLVEHLEPYVYGIEMQRRAIRLDGSWSEGDWDFVDSWCPEGVSLDPPEIELVGEGEGKFKVPLNNLGRVERFFDDLRAPQTQLTILRPPPPDCVNGSRWSMPLISGVSRRDVLLMDDEFLYPDQAPASDPEDRYPDRDSEEPGAEKEDEGPAKSWSKQVQALYKGGVSLLQRARKEWSKELAVQANNNFVDIVVNPETSGTWKTKAEGKIEECQQLIRDIERKKRGPGTEVSDEGTSRELLPAQQAWVYDGFAESIPGGKTYQYRVRLLLYNRYAGLPKKLLNPEDARLLHIVGPWSEPSEPVAIEADSRFFVTGTLKSGGGEKVHLEMFRWFEGVWVENSRAQFEVGDVVESVARAAVPMPNDPEGGVDRPLVEFEADATVLDIDFDRRDRRRIQGGKGVKFGQLADSSAVVFVDSSGRVFERLVELDKDDPDRATVKKRVWKAPRKKRQPSEQGPRPRPGRGRRPGPKPPPGPGPGP